MKDDLSREKAIEKLVASQLRGHLSAQEKACLDPELLAAYLERTLTARERLSCEAHLASCLRCQEQLAQLVRLSETDAPADHRVAVPRAAKIGLRIGLLRWAWVAPILAALVVAGVFYRVEFRPHLQKSEEIALRPPAPAPAPATEKSQAAATTQSIPQSFQASESVSPSAAQNAAKTLRQKKEPAEMDSLARAGATKITAAPSEAGEAAPGLATGHLAAGEARNTVTGAIARPSERARLAVAARAAAGSIEPDSNARETTTVTGSEAPPAPPAASESANEEVKARQGDVRDAKTRGRLGATSPLSFGGRVVALKTVTIPAAGNWRVGPRGLIQKADRGGKWITQPSGVTTDLYDITFSGPSIGWAVGQAGTALRTTDGGATWRPVSIPTSEDLVRVTATNDQAARLMTRSGQTLDTRDGGQSWQSP